MIVRVPGYKAATQGKKIYIDGTEKDCTAKCAENPECGTVDYNRTGGSCHYQRLGVPPACAALTPNPQVVHYKKYPCGKLRDLPPVCCGFGLK